MVRTCSFPTLTMEGGPGPTRRLTSPDSDPVLPTSAITKMEIAPSSNNPMGTLLFTTTLVPSTEYKIQYPPSDPAGPPNYEYGRKPGDLFSDLVFRSTDGGQTWGQPTQVYPDLNPHESALLPLP